jgi:hypothetical protein
MEKTYQIVRHFQREGVPRRIVKKGLTLEQAQAHCKDPETSSATCKTSEKRLLTQTAGPWFDGYEEEKHV